MFQMAIKKETKKFISLPQTSKGRMCLLQIISMKSRSLEEGLNVDEDL